MNKGNGRVAKYRSVAGSLKRHNLGTVTPRLSAFLEAAISALVTWYFLPQSRLRLAFYPRSRCLVIAGAESQFRVPELGFVTTQVRPDLTSYDMDVPWLLEMQGWRRLFLRRKKTDKQNDDLSPSSRRNTGRSIARAATLHTGADLGFQNPQSELSTYKASSPNTTTPSPEREMHDVLMSPICKILFGPAKTPVYIHRDLFRDFSHHCTAC